jgi:hypothetical protein
MKNKDCAKDEKKDLAELCFPRSDHKRNEDNIK